jgi:hypothetical protein
MKIRSLLLSIGLVIAIVIIVLQRSQISKLTADLQSGRQQLDQSSASDGAASNTAAQAPNTPTTDHSAELLRLRAQVTALRQQTNEIAKLQAENARMRAAVASARKTAAPSGEEEPPQTEERRQAIARLNDSRTYVLALIMHAEDNQQRLATNLDQIAPYLSKGERSVTGTNEFDIMFRGPREGITNSSSIILVRERQPHQQADGGWTKAYGFLDGHSEIRREATPNFDQFEQQHSWSPPGQ